MSASEPDSVPPAADRLHGRQRWWLDRSIRAKGLIVIAIPLIALLGTASASLALQHNEQQQRTVALAGRGLTTAADQLLANAVNAETGVRGYAATGDTLFLAPYNVALAQQGADRTSLREAAIAEGDSRQQRIVDGTTGKVFAEMEQLRSIVSRGVSASDLRSALENEKTTMDLLRRQEADLADGPAALIATHSKEITRQTQAIDTLNIAALVL